MEQQNLDYNANICEPPSGEPTATPSVEELFVDCPYKISGCTEKLEKGTPEECEHVKTCDFRPIACLMDHACKELVPYHNFLLHHQAKHFLMPVFSASLTATVVFQKNDFQIDQRWAPRLLHCYDRDFFLIVSHQVATGTWHFWVCMLGTQEEAENYFYDIDICKGDLRKAFGTYSVLSIRTEKEVIKKQEVALSMTNSRFRKITNFGSNLVGSFEIDLAIHKKSSTTSSKTFMAVNDDGGREECEFDID